MAKRKPSNDTPLRTDGSLPEINRLIARFLEDVAKDFNEISEVSSKSQPLVYGFNVRIGPDGEPIVNSFGNIRPTEPKVKFTEEREPLIDILDEEGRIIVLAEMPGVDRKTIKITANSDELIIEARDHTRNYNKSVRLPENIDPHSARSRFHNGVLELNFKKATRPGRLSVFKLD